MPRGDSDHPPTPDAAPTGVRPGTPLPALRSQSPATICPEDSSAEEAGPRPPPPCPAPAEELNPQTLQAHTTPRPRFHPPRLLPGTCTAGHPPGSPVRLPSMARPLPAPLPQHPSAGLWVFAPHLARCPRALGEVVCRASPPAGCRIPTLKAAWASPRPVHPKGCQGAPSRDRRRAQPARALWSPGLWS